MNMANSVIKWLTSWDTRDEKSDEDVGPRVPVKDAYLTFLCNAIRNEDLSSVEHFAHRVQDINKIEQASGLTALHIAARSKNSRCVWLLIRRGANVNRTDCRNFLPLHVAVEDNKSDLEGMKFLLNAGSVLEARDVWGKTPLHRAVMFHNIKAALLLISYGCDVNIPCQLGRGALSLLASENIALNSSERLIEAFVKNGAEVNMKDNKGRSSLYYAVLVRNISFLEKLHSLGIPMEFNKGLLNLAVSKSNHDGTRTLLNLGALVPKRLFHDEFIKICSLRISDRGSVAFVVLNTLLQADGRFALKQVVLEYLALIVSAIALSTQTEIPDELVNLICTLVTVNSMALTTIWPVLQVSPVVTGRVDEKLEYTGLPTLTGCCRTVIRKQLLRYQPNAFYGVNRLTVLPNALKEFLLFTRYTTSEA